MTEPSPNTSTPKASPEQTAAFWVQALHDLAQPVQALALFAERLRRMDLGPQAVPVVQHMGAGVQELQRLLQSLAQVAQVAQEDAVQGAKQAQPEPVESLPADVPGHAATQATPGGEGQAQDLRSRSP